jgi:hypothetical protein
VMAKPTNGQGSERWKLGVYVKNNRERISNNLQLECLEDHLHEQANHYKRKTGIFWAKW